MDLTKKIATFWGTLKQGERVILFMVAMLLVFGVAFWLLAITGTTDVLRVRDIYEGSPRADRGLAVMKRHGCRNCHTFLKVGEWGLAPGLDGEGTRREYMWIRAYLEDPARRMAGKTLHNGEHATDFSELTEQEKDDVATFLFALKAMPGSANFPTPPE